MIVMKMIQDNPSYLDFNDEGIGDVCEFESRDLIGIGNADPKAKLHILYGNVFLDEQNRGLILKSLSGNCYRIIISETYGAVGNLIRRSPFNMCLVHD